MSALNTFTRLLAVLPSSPPVYTHIFRLYSSGAAPQQPTMAPPSGDAGRDVVAASTASTRSLPASLALGLNFVAMDFDAIAKATHAAIARERGLGGSAAAVPLSTEREQELEAKLERQGEQNLTRLSSPLPTLSLVPQSSSKTSFDTYHKTKPQTVTPTSGAATATRSNSVVQNSNTATSNRSLSQQPRCEGLVRNSNGDNSNVRYSLHDVLKDCLMEGNWAKAYQTFINAVDQACRQVLIPCVATGNTSLGSSGADGDGVSSARQGECLAALKKMLAALPPTSVQDRLATSARRMNIKNLRGITRWNGQHYYLLWKCLLEAGHVEEVQHVWSVMQKIGFAEYQMEEKTVNILMALLLRTSRAAEQAATHMVTSAFEHTESFDERVERKKEIQRQLVKDLEQVATTRQLHLVGSNRRTAENIRIAEALRRVEESEGADTADGEYSSSDVDAAPFVDAEESTIAVGDFNGLLRRSHSTAATERILQMMAKLNLEMESSTFASLIASLHNPQYVLEGHTAEELAAHQPVSSADVTDAPASLDAVATPVKANALADNTHASVDTRTQYEAYKQERVETALRWFFQCPKSRRDADVYNELLYLLRAKSHWKDFDRVLVEFRGNAVVSSEEWPEATSVRNVSVAAAPVRAETQHNSTAEAEETEAVQTAAAGEAPFPPSSKVVPVILPPKWTTPPNGKTYELLIQRARYVHQWDVMWTLYEEMVAGHVRGTTRLYEVLLTEAHRHPPRYLNGVEVIVGDGGGSQRSSDVLLRLYGELRRNGGDVRSFKGTLNVVNAWSKSRAKMSRWE